MYIGELLHGRSVLCVQIPWIVCRLKSGKWEVVVLVAVASFHAIFCGIGGR
jgi:hypothetical protein